MENPPKLLENPSKKQLVHPKNAGFWCTTELKSIPELIFRTFQVELCFLATVNPALCCPKIPAIPDPAIPKIFCLRRAQPSPSQLESAGNSFFPSHRRSCPRIPGPSRALPKQIPGPELPIPGIPWIFSLGAARF